MKKDNKIVLGICILVFLTSFTLSLYLEFRLIDIPHKDFYINILSCIWTGSIFTIIAYTHYIYQDRIAWKNERLKEGLAFQAMFMQVMNYFNCDTDDFMDCGYDNFLIKGIESIFNNTNPIIMDLDRKYEILKRYYSQEELYHFKKVLGDLTKIKDKLTHLIAIKDNNARYTFEEDYTCIPNGDQYLAELKKVLQNCSFTKGNYSADGTKYEIIENSKMYDYLLTQNNKLNEFFNTLR